MLHWSSFIKTIFALSSRNWPTDVERISRVPLLSLKRAMRLPLAGLLFETDPKMVLINDDQRDIVDIVLNVCLFEKKLNHPIQDLDSRNLHSAFDKVD